MNRRQFLTTATSAPLAAARRPDGQLDFEAVREDFPRARRSSYFDNASCHPLSVHSAAALHRYIDWETNEVGDPWWPSWAKTRDESKKLFAQLINAKPAEIAFARSTIEAESNLLNGMNIQASGGNIVTNDLHYTAALYNYKMRQQAGLDVRIVRNRNWVTDLRDVERVIDGKTKLIALALVSNVNGYLQDIKAISDLAHSRGACVYADIIQCAGAIPIDVRAMGIDFAACSTYKWLMGVKGYGFYYVREDLQGTVVKPTQHSGGVQFNYAPWTANPDSSREDVLFKPVSGPARVSVRAEKARNPGRLSRFQIDIEVDGLDDERHREGVLRAVKRCLIHNTLLNAPEIEITLQAPVTMKE